MDVCHYWRLMPASFCYRVTHVSGNLSRHSSNVHLTLIVSSSLGDKLESESRTNQTNQYKMIQWKTFKRRGFVKKGDDWHVKLGIKELHALWGRPIY